MENFCHFMTKTETWPHFNYLNAGFGSGSKFCMENTCQMQKQFDSGNKEAFQVFQWQTYLISLFIFPPIIFMSLAIEYTLFLLLLATSKNPNEIQDV